MERVILATLTIFNLFVLGANYNLRAAKGQTSNQPNIVWIVADDLHYEVAALEKMPNLHRMQKEGLEFVNHVSQSPLCGPSRASMLVGRYPHNNGYRSQAQITPKFEALQHQSVGKWLTDSGYYTAFLGKYVNGIGGKLGKDVPTGWHHFGGFTREWDHFKERPLPGAYNYYNSSQWDLDYDETGLKLVQKENSDYPIIIWDGVHQADFLATQTLYHAKKAVHLGKPFFIFTNPVMIHEGRCEGPFPNTSFYRYDDPYFERWEQIQVSPCPRRDRPGGHAMFLREKFNGWSLHTPTSNFGKRAMGMPDWEGKGHVGLWIDRIMMGRRNRTLSLVDLDEMVGSITQGLEQLGVMDRTYLIFTSDNGYHLGEHSMLFGKETPYDHDLRVPLLIRTPRRVSGVRTLPTSHIDITRTIVDLAGAEGKVTPSLHDLDGKSFVDALNNDVKIGNWRRFSYSELFEREGKRPLTWRNLRFIGEDGKPDWSLHFWCKGWVEVYNLRDDPAQTMNLLDSSVASSKKEFGKQVKLQWLPVITGLGNCTGAICSDAERVTQAVDMNTLDSLLPCVD